jgi:hypothetical protein
VELCDVFILSVTLYLCLSVGSVLIGELM